MNPTTQADLDRIAESKIAYIARQASDVLQTKLTDGTAKILAAIAAHEEANQESETQNPFLLRFNIKLDWAGNKAVYALAFSTRYKDETCEDLPDQNQPTLPGIEDDGGGE